MDRQVKLVSAIILIGALAVLLYLELAPATSATSAERESLLAQQETELGLPPWPANGDAEQREARMLAKMEADLEQRKIRAYQQVLAVVGFITDPSPEEEAFLSAHRSDLPNLVIRRTDAVDVSLGYGLDGMAVESCRPDGRLLRCTVKTARGQWFEGWALTATASRFDGERFVDLPGALVSAPSRVFGVAELELLLPGEADSVRLSYRGSTYTTSPRRPSADQARELSNGAESTSIKESAVVAPLTGDTVSAALPPSSIAPPPPAAPVRVSGSIKPPLKIKDVLPQYPSIALSARVQGVVIIEATIGPNGAVQEARVLRSIPLLDGAALDAVKQWEFTPTLLNGVPVPVIMTVTVQFTLTMRQ